MRKKKSHSEPQFAMPSPKLLMMLAGLLLAALVYSIWPSSSNKTEGRIVIDGEPLKVGSLSLAPRDGPGQAMSFVVVDGAFQSAQSLPEGAYEAVVVVGNRLGMPAPQLKNTPLEKLNGARFQFPIQIDASQPVIQMDLSASEAVPLKKSNRTGGLTTK